MQYVGLKHISHIIDVCKWYTVLWKSNANNNRWISCFVLTIYCRYISETLHGLPNVKTINHIRTIFAISCRDIVLVRLPIPSCEQQFKEVRCFLSIHSKGTPLLPVLFCDIVKAHPQSRCYPTLIGWCWRIHPIRVEQTAWLLLLGTRNPGRWCWSLRKPYFLKIIWWLALGF